MNKKNIKKIAIIAVSIGILGFGGYTISGLTQIKNYEQYAVDNYEAVLNDFEYLRNNAIISNKDSIKKALPSVSKNVDSIDPLFNKNKKEMNINDRILISNEIEGNVTKIIDAYESDAKIKSDKNINDIMKNIVELDNNLSGYQKSFNDRLNDKDTGYNEIFNKRVMNKLVGIIYGLPKIDELKTK